MSLQLDSAAGHLQRLPLVTLYLSERCNSRCVTCDYWRHGKLDSSPESVRRMLPALRRLQTRVALISGGEPLLNPRWGEIAALLKGAGLKLWLLTSGLSLAKHAAKVSQMFDAVTVSMDGTNRTTYQAVRGVDAFDAVCRGIRASVAAGSRVGLRVTVQRANYRELSDFVALAHDLSVHSISFLAVDVGNVHAFARRGAGLPDVALCGTEAEHLGQLIDQLVGARHADFASGFIAENPAKLRRMQNYFGALSGTAAFPPVRCNAPEFSAVIGASGAVQPCFFIAGESPTFPDDLQATLNSPAMIALRQQIRVGERTECARCVCSLYRDPAALDAGLLL